MASAVIQPIFISRRRASNRSGSLYTLMNTRGERLRQCEQQLGDVTQVVDEIMERALGAEEAASAAEARAEAVERKLRDRKWDHGRSAVALLSSAVGARMDWGILTMLPAIFAAVKELEGSFRHAVLACTAFVMLYIFSTTMPLAASLVDRACCFTPHMPLA